MTSKNISISNKTIGEGEPVFIIAEAGVNHNGKLALAKKLVDVAQAAGADAVKFQTFDSNELATQKAGMAKYQKRNTGKEEAQLKMLKRLELTAKEFKILADYCKKKKIIFLSTPHSGFGSVDLLQKLKVAAFKFGSGDLNNLPVLDYAARFRKPMIISTGMGDMRETREAVQTIRKAGNSKIIVFQCTTDYPSTPKYVNLRAMQTIGKECKVVVGYSDHTVGIESSLLAVALGARVLEKHLTLKNNLPGPDHKASENPKDFKKYVEAVRNAEVMLGSNKKTIAPSSKQYIPLVLKSVVARGVIKKGEKITHAMLAIKRPQGGLAPKFYWDMLGSRATRTIQPDEFIKKRDYKK